VGVGGVASAHQQGYAAADADVVAIADPNEAALAARGEAWGVARRYRDHRQMFADGGIDAVSICTPTALHHPLTIDAAKAGVHVLCEKPLALDLKQADAMLAACRRAGVVLMVNHQLRSHPGGELARRMLDQGDLGALTHMRLRQAHDWGGAERVRESFGSRALAGGGTLLDNGCHLFDLARHLGGEVREVFARITTRKFDVEVEDTAHVSLLFESGAIGTIEAAWTATGWDEGWSLYGTHGSLEVINRDGTPFAVHRARRSPGSTWTDPDISEHRFAGLSAIARHVLAFVRAVQGAGPLVCSGQDGRAAVALVLAAYASAHRGAPVALKPTR
jgi:predicted dehydrogenase